MMNIVVATVDIEEGLDTIPVFVVPKQEDAENAVTNGPVKIMPTWFPTS